MNQSRFVVSVVTAILLLGVSTAIAQVNRFSQPSYRVVGPASFDTVGREKIQPTIDATAGVLEKEIIDSQYVVGPGDVLTINIPSAITDSYQVVVSPEGKVLLPQAGMVDVKGTTLQVAKERIREKLATVYRQKNIEVMLSKVRQFKVFVLGAVRIPAVVTANASDRVFDVIERAGGIVDTGSVRGITIVREGTGPIVVDLQKYLSYGDISGNPTVLGGDRVIVPLRNSRNTIRITGEMAEQGIYDYVEGDSLSTLIRMAGGFLPSAKLDSVHVVSIGSSSRLEEMVLDLHSWQGQLYTGSQLPGDIPLHAGDRVYVRGIPKWKQREEVVILGEVRFPGRYPIEPQQTTLLELIHASGGFTEKASIEDGIVIRTSEILLEDKEYERLRKLPPSEMSSNELQYYKTKSREVKGVLSVNFVELFINNNISNNPVLRDGDSIVVPPKNLYVNVTGSVRSPGRIVYREGLSYLDYIDLAGGYGFRADPEATLVVKGKGDQFPADSEQEYRIEPGDNILVLDEPEVEFIDVFTKALTITTQIVTVLGVVYTIVRLQ